MQRIISVGCLMAVVACATTTPPKNRWPKPKKEQLVVPPVVDDTSYTTYRAIFETLPPDHKQRPVLRDVLKRHLCAAGIAAFGKNEPALAERKLTAAAKLYDPAAVFRGVPYDAQLDLLAKRVRAGYAARGDVRHTLPALMIQISMRPKKKANDALKQEYERIVRWLETAEQTRRPSPLAKQSAIAAHERALSIWPSKFLVSRLFSLYMQRLLSLAKSGDKETEDNRRFSFAALQWTGYSIAKMYLWVDRPDLALKNLPVGASEQRDNVLRDLLIRVVARQHGLESYLQLASVFANRDASVALRICREAARAFPNDAQAYACIGQSAARLHKVDLAVVAYEKAHGIEPDKERYAQQLAAQYQRKLFTLVESERIEDARLTLARITAFFQHAPAATKQKLSAPLAKAFFALGVGQFNAGRISAAIKSLTASLRVKQSPEAFVQLATIDLKAGNGNSALNWLERARKLKLRAAQWLYWRCRIAQLSAKAIALVDHKRLDKARKHALRLWTQWLSLNLPPPIAAEAYLRRAESLFAVGQQAEALESIERAIDAAPERKESYADAIALLTTHGHLPEALDALHRALGRPEVTEYLKTYSSFWVINLARRAGLEPDPLAIRYLEEHSGTKWYHRIAAYVLGKITYAELKKHADTNGKRAELYYYRSETLLAQKRISEARELWRKVIATDMMAFFEYDMALHHLRSGPAPVITQPVERRPHAQLVPDPEKQR